MQLTGGDADVFLVALAQHIQTEEGSDIQLTVEDAAKTLLQDKYEVSYANGVYMASDIWFTCSQFFLVWAGTC